jgi:hypothetical protein
VVCHVDIGICTSYDIQGTVTAGAAAIDLRPNDSWHPKDDAKRYCD